MASTKTELTFDVLKAKHRAIRDDFPPSLSLRVHRALSWLNRAEMAEDDYDGVFIFLWIAFNAAYADELGETTTESERSVFDEYFRKLTDFDHDNRIYNVLWLRFPQAIRLLLENKYVFQPFWKHHNRVPGYGDWEDRFERSKRNINTALQNKDARTILSTLFDRLYVLRNQLIHGGATWNSGMNRDQVRDGANILGLLVPLFIDVMMDNPEAEWGEPYYPVVD